MTTYLFLFLLPFLEADEPVNEHIITSEVLGYDLKYWVHVPKGHDKQQLPVLFVTDGKWYMESGKILRTSQKLIDKGEVNPHIIVLVDAFDPNQPSRNRRNSQFLCNPDYVRFYKQELIPKIDAEYNTDQSRETRGMLGLSFGGLNSMYFALEAHDSFQKIGIQSPAPHPCPNIYDDFQKSPRLPLDIFLSTGTVYDKATETRRLRNILKEKGYTFEYLEVPEGHDWKNWKPMLDDILVYFYGEG